MKNVKPTLETIFISNNLIEIPNAQSELAVERLATILANLAYFGYTLSKEACTALMKMSDGDASVWWSKNEIAFKELSGENRNMGKYVVYKNFPKEVLDMSQAEYWIKQIFMYIGLPNKWFVQEEQNREFKDEKIEYKVLHLADSDSIQK